MKEAEMDQVAEWIDRAIAQVGKEAELAKIREEVRAFALNFPLPGEGRG